MDSESGGSAEKMERRAYAGAKGRLGRLAWGRFAAGVLSMVFATYACLAASADEGAPEDGASGKGALRSSGTVFERHVIDGDFDWATYVDCLDVDGDEDLDVLASGWNANEVAWWENVEAFGLKWKKHVWTRLSLRRFLPGAGTWMAMGTWTLSRRRTGWARSPGGRIAAAQGAVGSNG